MFFFSKMQATGNDFIIVNNLKNKFEYSFKLLSKFLCDRHFGVGADGVLILDNGTKAKYRMRIFNQDGSEAEMCGNGIRCFAKYLYEKKIIQDRIFDIETLAGVKEVKLTVEGNTVVLVEVNMGVPTFDFEKIPVYYDNTKDTYEDDILETIEFEELSDKDLNNKNFNNNELKIKQFKSKAVEVNKFIVYPVSIGNPHVVHFVDNVDEINIEKVGSLIENYKYFPNKTNVEFVQIKNEQTIKVRVWERGVGETLACGTGACASAIISNLYKSTKSELTVELKGGNLKINYDGENVYLKGSAEFVFEGKMNI